MNYRLISNQLLNIAASIENQRDLKILPEDIDSLNNLKSFNGMLTIMNDNGTCLISLGLQGTSAFVDKDLGVIKFYNGQAIILRESTAWPILNVEFKKIKFENMDIVFRGGSQLKMNNLVFVNCNIQRIPIFNDSLQNCDFKDCTIGNLQEILDTYYVNSNPTEGSCLFDRMCKENRNPIGHNVNIIFKDSNKIKHAPGHIA